MKEAIDSVMRYYLAHQQYILYRKSQYIISYIYVYCMKRKSSQGPYMKKGQAGAHVDVLQQKSLNIEITPLLCLLRNRLLNSFSVLESLLTPTFVTQGSLAS